MSRNTVIILVVILVVIFIFLIFVARGRAQETRRRLEQFFAGDKGDQVGAPAQFPLEVGSRGETVKQLQLFLNRTCDVPQFENDLVVDGIFGPLTAEAVDRCLADVTGHKRASVTWSEFKMLEKRYQDAIA